MKIRKSYLSIALMALTVQTGMAQEQKRDSLDTGKVYEIGEVVVTGTRNETDVRHLSQTVSVVNRSKIDQALQPSLLPVLTEQIPGLFVTSRGVMGYGVSGGTAGSISLRGLSLRCEPLLHRREESYSDPSESQRQRHVEPEFGRNRKYRRGNTGSIPHQPSLVGGRELQLPAHGKSGHCRSRA